MKKLLLVLFILSTISACGSSSDDNTDSPNSPAISGSTTQDTDKDGVADDKDNCPDVANSGQADTNDNGIGDVCETFNGLPVKFLTSSEESKWNGTYDITSNNCSWNAPTFSTVIVGSKDKSTAQLALHYADFSKNYSNGIFIKESSTNTVQLMFDYNESLSGSAIAPDELLAGKQTFSIKFYSKNNLSSSCSIWFSKSNVNPNPTNIYTVSGTVSGLSTGEEVILQNNSGDNLTVKGTGNFIFLTKISSGSSYKVTVFTSPNQKTCTVSNGTGTVSASNITNVSIICSVNAYTVGGNVSGLNAGEEVVLQNNSGDNLSVNINGDFIFPSKVAGGGAYKVTILTSPNQKICTVNNGTGTISNANIADVSITCIYPTAYLTSEEEALWSGSYDYVSTTCAVPPSFASIIINGTDKSQAQLAIHHDNSPTDYFTGSFISMSFLVFYFDIDSNHHGLASTDGELINGKQLLQVNYYDNDNLTNTCNSSFSKTLIANTYSVGGSVSGLDVGEDVSVKNNSSENLTVNENGAFVFPIKVADNGSYNVSVISSPMHKTCTVSNGMGNIAGTNITNVNIVCSVNAFSVGGSVSGLGTNDTLVLQNNNSANLSISQNGDFIFSTEIIDDGNYNVTVLTSPAHKTCEVSNSTGIVSGSNVTNVSVVCSVNTYTVGGTLSGLGVGEEVVLQNNNANDLTINANGEFVFSADLADGATYAVSVLEKPATKTCIVNKGSGVVHSNIEDIDIVCSLNTYTVGGTVSGLSVGEQIILQNNNGDNLNVNTNGEFVFSTKIVDGEAYAVSVLEKPTTKTCTVNKGAGTIYGNVTDINIACSINTYTIGGTVSGLSADEEVVLQNNNADSLTINANGVFVFLEKIAVGGGYNVTVLTSPNQKTCTISNGNGTVAVSNITNVNVVCSVNTYTLGGTVSGLINGSNLVLQNNETDDLLIHADGSFVFATAVVAAMPYSVSIKTQPIGQTCTVSNGSETIYANITNVAIECTTNLYTIGGTVSGLSEGEEVVLKNNGGDDLTVNENGVFEFSTQINHNNNYKIAVQASPNQKSCIVNNGTGTVSGSDVTGVSVACISLWARSVTTGPSFSSFSAVSVGHDGSIYAVGTINGTGTFNFGNNVTASGAGGGFIIKYNSGGVAQWANSTTGNYCEGTSFTGVSTDADGNIYVAGQISSTICDFGNGVTINGVTTSNGGGIVVKYNSDGIAQWGRVVATTSNTSSYFYGISVGVDDSIYAVGNIYGTGAFDFGNSITINATYGGGGAVIVKYNSAGIAQWAKSITTAPHGSNFNGVSAGTNGIYAVGYINGTGTFNFGNNVTVKGSYAGVGGGNNVVIVKYNTSGTAQWAKSVTTGSSSSSLRGVSVGTDDNIYVFGGVGTGTFDLGNDVTVNGNGGALIVKYNSAGIAQWAKSVISDSSSYYLNGVSASIDSGVVTVGYINGIGTFNFGNDVTVNGTYFGNNIVIVKYNTSGFAQWAKSVTMGTSTSIFNSVSAGTDGSIYAVGYIGGTSTFNFGNSVTVSGSNVNGNVVIVKYASE